MKQAAAIAIFVYKRAGHARRMLETLLRNPLAAHSPISIFCDGPRGDQEAEVVRAARAVVRELAPSHARIVEQERNLGLANSVIAGVSQVVAEYGQAITLEDDIEMSPVWNGYSARAGAEASVARATRRRAIRRIAGV